MCPALLDAPSPSDEAAATAAALVMYRLTAQLLRPADATAAAGPSRRPRHRRALAPMACGVARPTAVSRQAPAPVIAAFNARPRPAAKVVLEAVWWSPTAWQTAPMRVDDEAV